MDAGASTNECGLDKSLVKRETDRLGVTPDDLVEEVKALIHAPRGRAPDEMHGDAIARQRYSSVR